MKTALTCFFIGLAAGVYALQPSPTPHHPAAAPPVVIDRPPVLVHHVLGSSLTPRQPVKTDNLVRRPPGKWRQ